MAAGGLSNRLLKSGLQERNVDINALDGFFSGPHDNPPKWLIMLYAYFDESGQEQKENWMCVGGFLGNESQWGQVASLWAEAIHPRKHLHLKTLRFKKDCVRRTLLRAAEVPDKAGLTPLFSAVRVADYLDLIAGTKHEPLLSGYMVCCYAVVINTLRGLPSGERLEVVFEDQPRYSEIATMALRELAAISDMPEVCLPNGTNKLAKWSFVPKGSTPLLELADYFAYAELQVHRDKKSVRSQWCHRILETNRGDCLGAELTRQRAREIIRALTT